MNESYYVIDYQAAKRVWVCVWGCVCVCVCVWWQRVQPARSVWTVKNVVHVWVTQPVTQSLDNVNVQLVGRATSVSTVSHVYCCLQFIAHAAALCSHWGAPCFPCLYPGRVPSGPINGLAYAWMNVWMPLLVPDQRPNVFLPVCEWHVQRPLIHCCICVSCVVKWVTYT